MNEVDLYEKVRTCDVVARVTGWHPWNLDWNVTISRVYSFGLGDTLDSIAEKEGVGRRTVQRSIKRALDLAYPTALQIMANDKY